MGYAVEWRPDPDNVYLCGGARQPGAAPRRTCPGGGRLDHIGIAVAARRPTSTPGRRTWKRTASRSKAAPKTHRDGSRSLYFRGPEGLLDPDHPPRADVGGGLTACGIGSRVVSPDVLAAFGACCWRGAAHRAARRRRCDQVDQPRDRRRELFAAYGRWPTADEDNEPARPDPPRVVERRLRAADDADLPAAMRAARRRNLDLLRAYGWQACSRRARTRSAGSRPSSTTTAAAARSPRWSRRRRARRPLRASTDATATRTSSRCATRAGRVDRGLGVHARRGRADPAQLFGPRPRDARAVAGRRRRRWFYCVSP